MKSKIVVGSRVLILPAFAFDFDGALNEMCEKEVGKMATIYDLFDDGDASAIIDDGEMVRVRDVDVELQESAQQSVQSDGACTCGHQWSAHNENGCCWDDECQCSQPRR